MKKYFYGAAVVFLLTVTCFATNITFALNVSYNHGTSVFFEKSTLFLTEGGNNFIETKENKIGLGFNLSAYVPLMKKLYLSPGFTLNFGHQHYEYEMEGSTELDTEDHFFYIYSGEFNVVYDLLALKNGWIFDVFAGLNYNFFRADSSMREEDNDFLGMQVGAIVKFKQMKHLGFQAIFCYKMPFEADYLAYLVLQAGITYQF